MRSHRAYVLAAAAAFLVVLATLAQPPAEQPTKEAADAAFDWPRKIKSGDLTVTMYQPQIESWEGNVLKGRAAVAVEGKASPVPTYGVVWLTGRTAVDKEARTVTLEDVAVDRVFFPADAEKAPDYEAILRAAVKQAPARELELDRLEAALAFATVKDDAPNVPIKDDPPRVFVSREPSLLVLIDGKAVMRRLSNSTLLRVINTRSLLLFDEGPGRYYLDTNAGWQSSATLDGQWQAVATPPAALATVKESLVKGGEVDAPDANDAKEQRPITRVFVSTEPAELIETDGPPDLRPIPGTQLLEAKNTDEDVFLDVPSQSYYVRLSGRWFRSRSLEQGPWEYVPGAKLPADFAKIPEEHPAGDVLVSVPNTPQAGESLIANRIPQTATIKADEAKLAVAYDGEPQFEQVEGTAMQYAVNTPTPVVQVDPQSYYACDNGVWFRAGAPIGPWVVAVAVPPIIYTMPFSCPIYYCTHCRVYGAARGFVHCGYTAGYIGTCAHHGCVVYGTGYRYRPWVGTRWYGRAWSYGCGASFHYASATGWGFGFHTASVGYRPSPWWGPAGVRHYGANVNVNRNLNVNHFNLNHSNVYNRWGNNTVINSNRTVNRINNVNVGNRVGNTNVNVGNRTNINVNNSHNHLGNNNVFAGNNGNVYRQNVQGNWENRANNQWKPAQQNNNFAQQRNNLNVDSRSRAVGQQRVQNARSGGMPARSGGGMRRH